MMTIPPDALSRLCSAKVVEASSSQFGIRIVPRKMALRARLTTNVGQPRDGYWPIALRTPCQI